MLSAHRLCIPPLLVIPRPAPSHLPSRRAIAPAPAGRCPAPARPRPDYVLQGAKRENGCTRYTEIRVDKALIISGVFSVFAVFASVTSSDFVSMLYTVVCNRLSSLSEEHCSFRV